MKVNSKSIIINKLKNSNTPISGEELSKDLKISRTAVWKNIKKLTEEGYSITASHIGYILNKENDLLLPYEFVEDNELYIYEESTGSTMDSARSLILKNRALNGQIIVVEEQSLGRGKADTKYLSPRGGLYFTLILFPKCPLSDINLYPMAALIAIGESLREISGLDTTPKWPFETWLDNKKVSGILHEYSVKGNKCEWLTLGVGINIGKKIERRELLEGIKKRVDQILKTPESILDRYKKSLDIINKEYAFSIEGREIKGRVMDINRQGTLLLKSNSGFSYGYIGNSNIKEEI